MISINKIVEARGRNEFILRNGGEVRYWYIREKNLKTQAQCMKPELIHTSSFSNSDLWQRSSQTKLLEILD